MSFDVTMQIVVRYDCKNLTLVLLNIYDSLTPNLFKVETIGIVLFELGSFGSLVSMEGVIMWGFSKLSYHCLNKLQNLSSYNWNNMNHTYHLGEFTFWNILWIFFFEFWENIKFFLTQKYVEIYDYINISLKNP